MKKLIIMAVALAGFTAAGFSQTTAPVKKEPVKTKTTAAVTQKKTEAKDAGVQKKDAALNKQKTTPPVATKKTTLPPSAKTNASGPVKKDGTPDKRFATNKHLKKDGSPDKRYKEHKKG